MNNPKGMNHKQYHDIWLKQSLLYKTNGVYEKLADLLPMGKVLEIGSGLGFSTLAISKTKDHEVLCLDINTHLISAAKRLMKANKVKCNFLKCDVLSLAEEDLKTIQSFEPNIITLWLAGGAGVDVEKYINNNQSLNEKVMLYREQIEDVALDIAKKLDSVTTVHFVVTLLSTPETLKVISKVQIPFFKENGFNISKIELIHEFDTFTNLYIHQSNNTQLKVGIYSILAEKI